MNREKIERMNKYGIENIDYIDNIDDIRFIDDINYYFLLYNFIKRTKKHINLVQRCWFYLWPNPNAQITNIVKQYDGINNHDVDKFKSPEFNIYPYINGVYLINRLYGKKLHASPKLELLMTEMTDYHVKHSSHHPEYWDKNLTGNSINPLDKDTPLLLVDATEMTDQAIIEMVCDWKAVSIERKTDINTWAMLNINKRWKFNSEQIKLISMVIHELRPVSILWEDVSEDLCL